MTALYSFEIIHKMFKMLKLYWLQKKQDIHVSYYNTGPEKCEGLVPMKDQYDS